MNPGDLLWLFVILAALQPVLHQRFREASRARLLRRIESERGSRVISLIHRQETMSLLGFPIMRYISIEDSEAVLRAIHLTDPRVPIDLILHTPGGLAVASLQIARALADHEGKVTVMVPHYAMSGGTLIALAADQIVMHPQAVLGPLDPQVGGQPAVSVMGVVRRKPVERVQDSTLVLADVGDKVVRQLREAITSLLTPRVGTVRAAEVADQLTRGEWTHDFPITVARARDLGLPVSTDMPRAVYELMGLYPQQLQARPSVEYIPLPRRSPGPEPSRPLHPRPLQP